MPSSSSNSSLVVAFIVFFALLVSATVAEDFSQLVRLAGEVAQTRLLRLNRERATFLDTENRERSLPLRSIVRWGSLQDPSNTEQVLLSDGSILIGRVLELSRVNMVLETEYWGELTLPRRSLAGIVWVLPGSRIEQWKLRDKLIQDREDENETLALRNGDVLSGRLLSGDESTIRFAGPAGEMELKTDLVAAYRTGGKRPVSARQATVLSLRDGTRLVAEIAQLDDRLYANLVCGIQIGTLPEIRPVEENLLTYVRPANDDVTYLSGLQPLGHKHIPFLNTHWSWRADRNVLGGPISSRKRLHAKGIGMHSTSRLAFDLLDRYDEFQTQVCLDQSAGNRGSVVFRVFTTRDGTKWNEAFKSPIVRGGEPPLAVRVDVRVARRLALVVDFADRGDQLDRANWIGARVIRLPK